jgi:mono/diheme cytochrome c family protein
MNQLMHNSFTRAIAAFLFSYWLLVLPVHADGIPPQVQTFLDTHCIRCHGKDLKESDFRIDTLSPKVGFEDTPQWAEIMERINSGEMPPEDEPKQPTADQRAGIVEWIAARIKEGESARMARRERVSYRRLTREEYVYTVRDLIGVEYDATDPGGLFEDPQWHGFERIGSVLTLSPSHIEKYIKAAEVVLDEAYPPEPIEYLEAGKRAMEVREDNHHYERLKAAGLLDKARAPLTTAGEIYRYSNPWRGPEMKFPGPGLYEISYIVCGLKPEHGMAPRMKVVEADLDRVLFERDIIAPEDKPITVIFQAHFSNPPGRPPTIYVTNENKVPRHPRTNASSRIPFITTKHQRAPWQMKITNQDGSPRYPILIIDSLTMRGPIVTEEEQRRRNECFAKEESLDAVREGFSRLARRAFRRPLYDNELETYINIVKGELEAGETFRDAVKTGMVAILCSKSFLFIAEGSEEAERNELNDWELATRLSYLLWSTMPDDELFSLAENGKLQDRRVLQAQFNRMLADPRSERFTRSFSSQWLNLRKVGMFPPDKNLYPNYDDHLEQSMVGESQAFFGEVLREGLTLREFIDSDWTMLNPRLARFYGIPGVVEDRFQRVALKPEHHRGGLLTNASVLSLTSDGTRHRPVHRGAWLSEVFLGKEPPPPPANVDPIEPTPTDAPKATLRMKLEAHKSNPNCAACHRKIDPLGLAFDHYDAIGQWRAHEKVEGIGDDPPVDASGELPDGRAFSNAKEFQHLLMADLDAFNRTFIEKLAIYGLRRTMTFDDRKELQAIAEVSRTKDYRVRAILEAFVLSDLFRKR